MISTSGYVQNNFFSFLLLVISTILTSIILMLFLYSKILHPYIINVFLLLSTLLMFFLLIELFSRILIPYESHFDHLLLGNARKRYPYIEFKGDSTFNKAIDYPDKANMQKKGPSEYRIFLFGGSTVTGGKPPISDIIEAKFFERGYSNVHVYNVGVIASNANMELARVVYEVSDYSPDLIVFYNGGNDIMSPLLDDPRPGYPYNFCAYANNLFYDVNSYPVIALVAYKSNLLRVIFRSYFTNLFGKRDELRKQVKYGSEIWEDEIAEQYVSALTKADKISKAFGAEFAAFLQPTVYYKNHCTSATEIKWRKFGTDEYNFNLKLRKKILLGIDSSGISNFFDLTTIYENDPKEYFIDWIHTNQPGINIVAQEIFIEIFDCFKIPKPSPELIVAKRAKKSGN